MAKISYVNGRFIPHCEAVIAIDDRGHHFSDGIYEVTAFYNRKLLDGDRHDRRMSRSLKELRIAEPMTLAALQLVMKELIRRNDRENGTIYLQITRGIAKRDHPFPAAHIKPSLTMIVSGIKLAKPGEVEQGAKVITARDIRWGRRDIKSISLLPNILAKQQAVEAKVREAWLVDEQGVVSEGSSTNAYIVNANGEVVTHPANERILGGITRDVVLELARKNGVTVKERPFTLEEAEGASEAFLTSTTQNVMPIIAIDGKTIGSGKPGPVTLKLLRLYYDYIEQQTGFRFP